MQQGGVVGPAAATTADGATVLTVVVGALLLHEENDGVWQTLLRRPGFCHTPRTGMTDNAHTATKLLVAHAQCSWMPKAYSTAKAVRC